MESFEVRWQQRSCKAAGFPLPSRNNNTRAAASGEGTARKADGATRASYERAHADYLARRDAAADAEGTQRLPPGTQSAGGMPDRVKCLHALVAHELAVPSSNPFGREALAAMGDWWSRGPCVTVVYEPPPHEPPPDEPLPEEPPLEEAP